MVETSLPILYTEKKKDFPIFTDRSKGVWGGKIVAVLLVLGWVAFLFGLFLFVVLASTGGIGASPVCSVFIVPGIVLIILYWILSTPQRRVRREMKRKRKDPTYAFRLAHIDGLRLAQGTSCVAHYENGMVEIQGGGARFQLDIAKIMKAEVRTETEIQRAYVSSAGGAVAGAMMFGALGAMIGGRTKEQTSSTSKSFLILTYLKNDEIAYISFRADYAVSAYKFADFLMSRLSQNNTKTVEL